MSRISRDQWALTLAKVTSMRSTCLRRQVGCVLLNSRGHVLATGYNGVAAGLPHCNEVELRGAEYQDMGGRVMMPRRMIEVYPQACPGAQSPSGTDLDSCNAIHAEQNALMQCRDVHTIETAYVTTSPCVTCAKLLLNTSCKRVVFEHAYSQPGAEQLWRSAKREWFQLELTDDYLL